MIYNKREELSTKACNNMNDFFTSIRLTKDKQREYGEGSWLTGEEVKEEESEREHKQGHCRGTCFFMWIMVTLVFPFCEHLLSCILTYFFKYELKFNKSLHKGGQGKIIKEKIPVSTRA